MEQKNPLQHLYLFLKGIAMGAADVVPGVSGGTIAFISGIYEELVNTIHNLNFSFFKIWKENGFKKAWIAYNLTFLTVLFSGIFISIISLAKLIGWLLDNHPILVWSFFFGLIVASIIYVGKEVKPWKPTIILALLMAALGSYFITLAEPMASPESNWYILFSGFIAIIAMILPGISGSFILLLLGSYEVIINTINDFSTALSTGNWELLWAAMIKILIFIAGAIVGIKLFSGVLNWLFKNYKNLTMAILTGFMVGALNKIWPWKDVLSWRINTEGKQVALLEESISPFEYAGDPQVLFAVICAFGGFLSIFLIEFIAVKKVKKE
jgi:putative membrane protein